jgi:hypothetical protein
LNISRQFERPPGAKTEHGRRNNHGGEAQSRRGYAGAAARSIEGEDLAPNS